jgi:repressor LexA
VKRFERKGDRLRLLPENAKMDPIVIANPKELKIVGIVVGLIRRYR